MANQKISNLTSATAIEDDNLFPIVQPVGDGEYVTRKTTIGDLKGSVLASGAKKIVYTDGTTALEATSNQLIATDKSGVQRLVIDPLNSKVNIHAQNAANTQTADWTISDAGIRFYRQVKDAAGVTTKAWQIRMNSDNTYIYGGKNLEFVAGAKKIDAITDINTLGSGNIKMMSGGEVECSSKGEMRFTAGSNYDIIAASGIHISGAGLYLTAGLMKIAGIPASNANDLSLIYIKDNNGYLRTVTPAELRAAMGL